MIRSELNTRIAVLFAVAFASQFAWAGDGHDTPEHVVGENPYPFDTVDPRDEVPEPIELPDSVAPKLALLTEEEVEFLESGDE